MSNNEATNSSVNALIDEKKKPKSYLRDSRGKHISFGAFKNQTTALIGISGCGKTPALLMLHEHLNTEETLVLDPCYENNAVNNKGQDIYGSKGFKEFYGIKKPRFTKSTTKKFGDEVKLENYKNILIEEAWRLEKFPDLINKINKVIAKGKHTVIFTFMTIDDANELGFDPVSLFKIKSHYGAPRDTFSLSSLFPKEK